MQQDSKFCCLGCGTVHDCWDPLGLSAIDEVHGFRFRVFSSGVRVLVFSSGVPLFFSFLSGTRTRFCCLETDFAQEEHVDVSVFETQTKQGVKAYEVLGLS